jgi:hypothetical protein
LLPNPLLGCHRVKTLLLWIAVSPVQVICEFLEHAAPAVCSSDSSSAAIDPLLTLGAVRVLGRFLADVPDAHQEALRKLLPQLLALRMRGQDGADQGSNASSAVCFLLPALLCWTAPSNASQQWTAVLLAPGGGCLQALAGFAGGAAAAAAALAGSLDAAGQLITSRGSSNSGALDELLSVESQLGTACQVMHQLLASIPAARTQQQQQQQGAGLGDLHEQHLQPLALLLQQLGSWASVRHKQQQLQQTVDKGSSASPAAVSTAAACLQSLQTLWLELPVLLPAAALTGHLLSLLAAKPADAGKERAGALLLAWGCEAGWSYQLLDTWQQPDRAARVDTRHGLQELLMQLQDAWLSADLGEVWDACLSVAADLLVEGQCSSLLNMLAGAAWLQEAAQAVAAMDATVADGRRQQLEADAVTRVVLEDNMALQLLARAVSRA